MKFELERLDGHKVQVQVEVDEAQVALALQQSFKKVVKQVSVPGFRKGKVPRVIFEQRYGVEALYEEAIDILLPQAFQAALDENKLESIDRPEADVVTFEQGQPAVFTFVIQIPPEVELGEYLGVEAEQPTYPVTEDDVEQHLERLREQHSRLVDASDQTVADQDFVTLDYQGFVAGEAFAGGQATDYSLQIGSNTFIPGFEQQLIGLTRGQSAEIEVTFPEEYHEETLAGKPATFQVTVKEIKRKEIPALDDDFAAEVSEHETVEELRLDTQNKLEKAASEREQSAFEANVIQAVVENASVDIPEVMITREVDEMIEELSYNLARQGFPQEFAREYIGGRIDAIRADYQETARDRVKTRLVLKKLTETMGISVSDQDLAQKLQEMAELYQQDIAEIQSSLEARDQLQSLRDSIATERAIEQLVTAAKPIAPAEPVEQNDNKEVGE